MIPINDALPEEFYAPRLVPSGLRPAEFPDDRRQAFKARELG